MKLPIESWIDQRGYNTNIKQLFNESFICFKNGAFRASLLYSYTAFLTIIKHQVLKGVRPASIVEGRWNDIIKKVQNDDEWEARVYEELVNGTAPIFNTKAYVRDQIKYWKDRRNDAAHFKDNPIASFHVETFWSFLQNNLAKITLEGGRDSLLQKFKDHFDPNKTRAGADFTHLVREVDTAIEKAQLKGFLDQLINDIDSFFGLYDKSDSAKVINLALEITEDATKEIIVQYLKEKQLDLELASEYTDKILLMNYSDPEVRQIWRVRMFRNGFRESTCKIFASLLRNNLIPHDDVPEALGNFFDNYSQTSSGFYYSDELHLALSGNNFGEVVFQKAIVDKQLRSYKWVNNKCDLIAYYFDCYPLRAETVECVCRMSNFAYPSQWLEKAILSIFADKPAKKAEFHQIANQNGFAVPALYQ